MRQPSHCISTFVVSSFHHYQSINNSLFPHFHHYQSINNSLFHHFITIRVSIIHFFHHFHHLSLLRDLLRNLLSLSVPRWVIAVTRIHADFSLAVRLINSPLPFLSGQHNPCCASHSLPTAIPLRATQPSEQCESITSQWTRGLSYVDARVRQHTHTH